MKSILKKATFLILMGILLNGCVGNKKSQITDQHAHVQNQTGQRVYCSCLYKDENGNDHGLVNFVLNSGEEESRNVGDVILSCCHDFSSTPDEQDCWSIRAGQTKVIRN